MEKVTAVASFHGFDLGLDCPHCESELNLSNDGCKVYECPSCKNAIEVENIYY